MRYKDVFKQGFDSEVKGDQPRRIGPECATGMYLNKVSIAKLKATSQGGWAAEHYTECYKNSFNLLALAF
jgi:hypothetical protein